MLAFLTPWLRIVCAINSKGCQSVLVPVNCQWNAMGSTWNCCDCEELPRAWSAIQWDVEQHIEQVETYSGSLNAKLGPMMSLCSGLAMTVVRR